MAETKPGGRIRDIPREHRGAHPRRIRAGSIQTVSPSALPFGLEQTGITLQERINDPALVNIPMGASLSTGPITQDGTYTIGAPDRSAFRFDRTEPKIDGQLISRHGRLWLKDKEGNLTEPPEELLKYGWANTRKTHLLLPGNFRGADSARTLPNFDLEDWLFE